MGGFFGSISEKPCINDVYYGTDYNSHMGTLRAGIVTFDREKGFNREIHSIERDYFRSKFEESISRFEGNVGMGVISDTDPQPIIVNSHLGRYAVVTVAKISNARAIADKLLKNRMHLSEMSANKINQTELVALLINTGEDFVDGINRVYREVDGSCSMLIMTEDSIIAARDYLGRTPIVIGRKEGAYAATSESCAFANLGYERVCDVGPGEVVRLTANKMEVLRPAASREQICAFLWVYYGFPASDYNGINAEAVREACGRTMGEYDEKVSDCVCGIPDSGVGFALGYSDGNGVPYQRAVLKYTPTWPRSFTPGSQDRRDLVARMKLIPNGAILKDKNIVFCDDSIVRGTQLRDNVSTFYAGGAKSVHARISCPPLVYGCPFIGFTNSRSDLELISRRIIEKREGRHDAKLEQYATAGTPEYNAMVEEIARQLGLTSVKFARMEDLINAIGLPKCRVCTHCFDGTSLPPNKAYLQDNLEKE